MTDQKLLPGRTIADLADHQIEDRHQELLTGRTLADLAQKALPRPDPAPTPTEAAADLVPPLETPSATPATAQPARHRARGDSHRPPAPSSALAGPQHAGEHHVHFAAAREGPVDLAGNEVVAEAGEVMREWGEEGGQA
ncbi:hypothetical protein JCM21900_006811 [Sporobolomyces salmonicolor]